MLASLVVLAQGRTVLEKRWRHSIPPQTLKELWSAIQNAGSTPAPPAMQLAGQLIVHVARGQLVLVGALARDAPVLLAIELLHRVGDLLELYFKELSEEALRANFVTVYQLLDEVIENGVPLHTEPNVLQQLVMQPGKMDSIVASVMGTSQVRDALPESTSSASPWRKTGVRYATNELYLDLHERLDVVVDGRNGVLQHAEVYGEAMCNCMLSRMPRLTLTFTHPHIIEDCSLHVCASKDRWERDRVISFVPPDGKFELFTYRIARTNQIPIYVTPNISFVASSSNTQPSSSSAGENGNNGSSGGGGAVVDVTDGDGSATAHQQGGGGIGHVSVTLGARPTEGRPVEEVSVRIPLPSSTLSTSLTASVGSVVHDAQSQEVRWTIGRIPKERLPTLNGTVTLGPGRSARELSLSLFVSFKVNMYSSSGLKVASLRVENEEHQPYKGVRSITRAGRFEVRC